MPTESDSECFRHRRRAGAIFIRRRWRRRFRADRTREPRTENTNKQTKKKTEQVLCGFSKFFFTQNVTQFGLMASTVFFSFPYQNEKSIKAIAEKRWKEPNRFRTDRMKSDKQKPWIPESLFSLALVLTGLYCIIGRNC